MTIATRLQEVLAERKIAYQTIAHPRTFCSSDTAKAAHIPDDHIAKGVVLKDRQGYLLAVIPASEWLDVHRLQAELDRDLHLAEESEVERLFADCEPGAVPPIGSAYGLETVLDEALTSLGRVYFEAGDHEQLIGVTEEAFHELMRGIRHGHFSQIH